MATITSAGGVLDVSSMVSQLVAAERTQLAAPINRRESAANTQMSALGQLKGALAAFKSALEPLKSVDVFQTRSATSGNSDYFTASAAGTAAAGHYDVEVVDLAQSHQLTSAVFAQGSSTVVGYGDLTISVGGESFTVQVSQDGATLANIRDAINADVDNTGVQATLLNGAGGSRLILTSTATGAAKGIEVSTTGGDGGLSQFVYDAGDPDAPGGFAELREAQDGLIRIAGFDITSTTNVFKDAIDGVTITAKKKTAADETFGLDISLDNTKVTERIQKFITEYNTMQGVLKKLGSYDAATKAAGPMLGDGLLRGVTDELRRNLSNPIAGLNGDYTTLASLGIKTTASGTLELDSAKLSAAIADDPEGIAQLFGSENGVAARMFSSLEKRLADKGDVASRNESLTKELKGYTRQREVMEVRLEQIQTRYRKQFVALDAMLTQMQSTSNYLAQQLSSLPGTR